MEIIIVVLLVINTGLVFFLFARQQNQSKDQFRLEQIVREEIAKNREELGKNLNQFFDTFSKRLESLTQANDQKAEKLREVVERQLKSLQEDNSAKLEKMRETVDEKLQSTLEKRLGESFKIVSERLEKVHAGLGEMQTLALGVGDLKKVLMNVKTKGNLGEIQLGALLEQVLSSEQYEQNIILREDSRDPIEFAVKFPGTGDECVYLPIDSKFPTVHYERLMDAQELADKDLIESAYKALESQIKMEAKKIKDKYIEPPKTTDFAILFLPFEGLYAEVLRRPGLFETLRRDYKVTITGPTTIVALLNSFQMGFRTLAVQKRASEVWNVLGTVKTEFGRFGAVLEATKKKLDLASKEIDKATVRTRAIERNLRDVQELPATQITPLIEADEENDDEEL